MGRDDPSGPPMPKTSCSEFAVSFSSTGSCEGPHWCDQRWSLLSRSHNDDDVPDFGVTALLDPRMVCFEDGTADSGVGTSFSVGGAVRLAFRIPGRGVVHLGPTNSCSSARVGGVL